MNFQNVISDLQKLSDPVKAKNNAWFFKTGPGQYGEGDEFIGVSVPNQRAVANKYKDLPLNEVINLIHSAIHEHRLTGVFILVSKFERSESDKNRQEIFSTYIELLRGGHINNWDIVDSSAHKIVGAWLVDKNRSLLYKLARTNSLWQQRAAIIATVWFIKEEDYKDTLLIAEILLENRQDLIHKAVGWMLREIGNKDRAVEEMFLKKHYKYMPRTMLRYAIEKFPEDLRIRYLSGKA